MEQLYALLQRRNHEMLVFLRSLVEIESPSSSKAGTDRLGKYLAERLAGSGFTAERHPQVDWGDHWTLACSGETDSQVLVLCHMDTVWPTGEISRRPFKVEGEKAYGPGIYDMKGVIAQLVFAIEALRSLGRRPKSRVVVLLNSDEEAGSPTSRPIIEECARKSRLVLVAEPSTGQNGALKTFRKAGGYFTLKVSGVPAHAAADHARGRSAVKELAHQILYLEGLTDYIKGTTVNVGIIGGGDESICTVPERAFAHIDLRVALNEEIEPMVSRILGLGPVREGTSLEVSGYMHRPLMERTLQIAELYYYAKSLMQQIGVSLEEAGTGGASDGNFTGALGVPTLDGLGSVGEGSHALHEHVIVHRMPERAALMAKLLETL